MATNTDSTLNKNSYISFDATSINQLIIDKLNKNEIFTDQNYQGSNISSLLDVVSYTFSTLLYYLNKTSSESMFSETQIYENMNRIVKLLNYNPRGKLTQTVGYTIQATLPEQNNYMIPRYSNVKIGSLIFSFAKDIYFTYYSNNTIELQNPETDFFLYEGNFNEYPLYNALGAINEVLFLNLGAQTFIDHNNIHVYVKEVNTDKWVQWNRSENLFLNKSSENVFEIRYNPNQNYEVKFGDNINGKQLNSGDSVLVYYLQITPDSTSIAAKTLNNSKITTYNSVNYVNLLQDTIQYNSVILGANTIGNVVLNNEFPSSPYISEESVDEIRKNAPKNFSYQQRLITANDFETYILNNYSNIFADCKVVGNDDYLKGHIKYLYDIGIKSPQLNNTILYNQVKFSNSCNFNNVYIYVVPLNGYQNYASASQKELFLNDVQDQKVITSEIVPMDPIYMLFDFYVKDAKFNPSINDLDQNFLYVYKKLNTRQSNSGIINSVIQIIKKSFDRNTVKLSHIIDINQLATEIINLEGVDKIKTYRSDTETYVDGLSLVCWNKNNPELDIQVHNFNFKLDYFQYPIFNNVDGLVNRIKIIETNPSVSVTDY